MKKLYALGAALLLLACVNDSGNGPAWFGLISNSCGHTDGPTVAISLDSTAYSGCSDYHQGEFRLFTDDYDVDSIRVGRVLADTEHVACRIATCNDSTIIRVEIEKVDTGAVYGNFKIQRSGPGAASEISGSVILKKCKQRMFCG